MFDIRKRAASCAPLNAAYKRLRSGATSAVFHFSPELLLRLRYRQVWGKWPDLENPITFDEKLIWLNLYWRHPLKTECADKYKLRGHVERQGLEHLLPHIYGVYETAGAIDFGTLPQRFVLKCTHACKCNVFCADKMQLDVQQTRRELTRWLATDFSTVHGELHYAGMKPRILCEEFLDDGSGELPTDYKLYCSRGHVHCTLVCSGRRPNENASFDYLDRGWNLLPYDQESLAARRPIARPAAHEEMISAAERLSAPFPFVRVDFYNIRGRAVLGEMTFTPSACLDTTMTELAIRALGDLIELPDKLLQPRGAYGECAGS